MGIQPPLIFAFKFIYQTRLDPNLIEHEYDHVYLGAFDGEPVINKEEVEDWKFAELPTLRRDIIQNPDLYTYWFRLILGRQELDTIRV